MNETSSVFPRLSVIAPMYNEELIIRHGVTKLIEALEELKDSWELILVNDGSTDRTLDIISEIVSGHDRVKVISYKNNRGRGYALRTGFKHCRGDHVITTESDLTYGMDIISRLYKELLSSEADIVIASPYTKGGKLENVPFRRCLLSWLGNRLLRMTVPSNITTLTGMTRGYKGAFIRSLPLEEDGKEIHLEIVSKACMLGRQFSEIPATMRWAPSAKGKPKRKSKFKASRLIRSHLLFGFNEAPILLFGTVGSVAILVGLVFGCYLSYMYFLKGEVVGDRVVLIMTTIFLLMAGFSMFVFCFLAYQMKTLRKELFKLYNKLP
jgi:glycosyltransferase involved in cell wall biosynthesis